MVNLSAEIFNSVIVAAAITAALELGILDEIAENKVIELDKFCCSEKLHYQSVVAIVTVLIRFNILKIYKGDSSVTAGSFFGEIYNNKGFFIWLVKGYGHLLNNLAFLAHKDNQTGSSVHRDGAAIANACQDCGAKFVDPHFESLLDEEPFLFGIDLGCGSAERLIRLAKMRPSFQGIGIDVNPDTVEVAQKAVKSEGLNERITILQQDVKSLHSSNFRFSEVDLLFSFFMGHDLWPREKCLKTLQSLPKVFPNAQRFLLCDTYRSDLSQTSALPIFTLGFEFTHAVMGQYVPQLSEWMELFSQLSWKCVNKRDVDVPFSSIFDLRFPS